MKSTHWFAALVAGSVSPALGCAAARPAATAAAATVANTAAAPASALVEWPGDEEASFAMLDPIAAALTAPFDAEADRVARAHLAAAAAGADVAAWTASARDRVLLHRLMALADAARWTAHALWRSHHAGTIDRAAENAAADAITAAYLRQLESAHPAVAWYSVRLAGFLEHSGTDLSLARRLRAPALPLREALARWLGRGPAIAAL